MPVTEAQLNALNQPILAEDGLEKIEQEGDESKIDDEVGEMPSNLKSKSASAIKSELVSEEYSEFLNGTASKV